MVMVSGVASAVKIGDEYGGGIVFYVDGTGNHGLVAAKADFLEEMNWEDAKSACESLVSNSYSDWFLPNKEQLNLLYNKRSAVGGFSGYGYWSSTEYNAGGAWGQNFVYGYQFYFSKFYGLCVRAVRAF